MKGVIGDHAAFHKGKAVEEVLRRLEAEGNVLSLVGWRYIRQALNALPLCLSGGENRLQRVSESPVLDIYRRVLGRRS